MKILCKSILILSVVLLVSCAKYQHQFGGKSGDYTDVKTTEKVQYPTEVDALPASDRYSIPEIKTTKDLLELTPPDYRN